MKKMILVCALAAAFCAGAAQLKRVENLRAGDLGTFGPGKISSVEVVSESASGTVALKRVTAVDICTNVYGVAVLTNVAISVTSVTTNRYFDNVSNGVVVATYTQNQATNHLFIAEGGGVLKYENFSWLMLGAGGVTNARVRVEVGVGFDALNINFGELGVMNERKSFVEHCTTNVTITTATNSVTPVLKKRLSVTNSVVNGSCSGGYYKGAPEGSTWLFGGDHLIFEGTATGGLLRLVIE